MHLCPPSSSIKGSSKGTSGNGFGDQITGHLGSLASLANPQVVELSLSPILVTPDDVSPLPGGPKKPLSQLHSNLSELCTEPSPDCRLTSSTNISLVCLPRVACGSQAANSVCLCSQNIRGGRSEKQQKTPKTEKENTPRLAQGFIQGRQWQHQRSSIPEF